MTNKAHLDIDGTRVVVINAEGRHNLVSIVKEACKDLDNVIMDELRSESNGNVSLAFNNSFFPRAGELEGPERSMMNYKKCAAQARIYEKLLDLGLDANDITFSSGFMGKNRRTGDPEWVPAARIFFNKPGAQRGQTVMSQVEDLESKVIELGGDIDELLVVKAKLEGKDAMYLGYLKAKIKNAEVRTATRETTEEIHGNVPESDEVPDTGNI